LYYNFTMKLVDGGILLSELEKMADVMFGGLVKAVVDVEREIMVVDAGMHADEEDYLLKNGSDQKNLWGVNIYPKNGDFLIEFDSMINLRPQQGNLSRGVEDPQLQKKIQGIVRKLVLKK